jgi:hypothetical protein
MRAVGGEMTDGQRDYLSRLRGKELADLRWHWDEAYEITWDSRFRAKRLDDGGEVEADTAAELNELIIRNYSERRVPRPPI